MNQETDLNDSLYKHLCRKDNTSSGKAWRERLCMNNLKPISSIMVNAVFRTYLKSSVIILVILYLVGQIQLRLI